MTKLLSAMILALAVFDTLLGFGFLTSTAQSGEYLGLAPTPAHGGVMGLSTMRADMTAFFLVAAGFMLAGAWHRRPVLLAAPLALFAIALAGRAVNLALMGPYPGWWVPMAVEGAHVVLLALAMQVFRRARANRIAGY